MENKEKGITLIALVITIIVLLILAGVAIATLTGDNGILTKAVSSKEETDIAETKEQIKLEIMGNLNDEGKYTNTDVVKAVKKITGKQIEENVDSVQTSKGNNVDLTDLWVAEGEKVTFTVNGREITLIGEELYFTDWINSVNKSFDWYYMGAAAGYFFFHEELGGIFYKNGEEINFSEGDWGPHSDGLIVDGDTWLVKNNEGELIDIWGENNK